MLVSGKEPDARSGHVPAPDRDPVAEEGQPTILFVEDDLYVAETMRMLLASLGYHVLYAANAREALTIIESGTALDLVLSDIVMPGPMDGLDLARHLRQSYPTLPIVLASGYAHSAQDALSEGFTLVGKPYPADLDRILSAKLPPGKAQP